MNDYIRSIDLLSLDPVLIPAYRYLASYLLNNDIRIRDKIPQKPFDLLDNLPDIEFPYGTFDRVLTDIQNAHENQFNYEWVVEKIAKGCNWELNEQWISNYFVYGLIASRAGVPEWLIFRPYEINEKLNLRRPTFWGSNKGKIGKHDYKYYLNDSASEYFAEHFLMKLGMDFFEEIAFPRSDTGMNIINTSLWENIINRLMNDAINDSIENIFLDYLGQKRENLDNPLAANLATEHLLNRAVELGGKAVSKTIKKRLFPYWPSIREDFNKNFYKNMKIGWDSKVGVKIHTLKQNENTNCYSFDAYAPIPDEPKEFNDMEAYKAILKSQEYHKKVLRDPSLDFYNLVKMAITPARYHIKWFYGEVHPRALLYIPYTLKYNKGTVSIAKNPHALPDIFSGKDLNKEILNAAIDLIQGELLTAAFGATIASTISHLGLVVTAAHVMYEGYEAVKLNKLRKEMPLVYRAKAQEAAKRKIFESLAKQIYPTGAHTIVFHNIMKRAELIIRHNERVLKDRCGNYPKWEAPKRNKKDNNRTDNSKTEQIPPELGKGLYEKLNRDLDKFYKDILDQIESGANYGLVNIYNPEKRRLDLKKLIEEIGNTILQSFTKPLWDEGLIGGARKKYIEVKSWCSDCSIQYNIVPDDVTDQSRNGKNSDDKNPTFQQNKNGSNEDVMWGSDWPEIPPELRDNYWPNAGIPDWYDW